MLASVVGMGFVRSKLFDLTEKSTPFQTRSMELQRAIHAATADLVKVGVVATAPELKTYRQEAEASLAQVKQAEEAVETLLSGKKIGAHGELEREALALFGVSEERLKMEEGAVAANNQVREQLKGVTTSLNVLGQKVAALQSGRSSMYGKSLETTKAVASSLQVMQDTKLCLKDLQVWCFELQNTRDKGSLEAMQLRGTVSVQMAKGEKTELTKNSSLASVLTELDALEPRVAELVGFKTSLLEKPTAEIKQKYDETQGDILSRVSLLLAMLDQEITAANQKSATEAGSQGQIFGQVNKATSVLHGASELTSLGLSTEGLATRLFTVNGVKEVEELQASLADTFAKIEKLAKTLDATLEELGAKDERKMVASAMAGMGSMKNLLFSKDGVIDKVRNQLAMREKAAKAMEGLRGIVLRQAEEAKKTMTAARGAQEQSIIDVNRMVHYSTWLVVVIGLAAVLFGIGFGAWIYRSISKPLSRLMVATEEIASGNLAAEMAATGEDEIGRVESSMAKMIANLKEIVGRIRCATESLASSSEELTATARHVDQGSEHQSSQVEQAAGAMVEMSQTAEEVARNASETSEAARSMKKIALDGKEIVHSSGNELAKFVETVNQSAQQVESLGKSSEEIHNIVDLIKEIADQTNLLALNAAIEAARAGEQGRGFAVVADNVRELAEKTMAATNDISHTIEKMQGEIGRSVASMLGQKQSVGKVSGQIGEALTAMDGVVGYVEKVADMVDRIAVAMEEQSATSAEVTKNTENIASVTRQLRHSSAGMKETAEELAKLSTGLNQTISWFRT